ncbi:MAG: lipid-A-disaccharide synthase [Holosporales bacterium]
MKLFLSAGELSGDILGAAVARALRAQTTEPLELSGIGADAMAAAGIESLFPASDLAVMGIVEVLPRLPLIFRRLKETTAHILQTQPDVVLTIDAPGFNVRLARRLRAARDAGQWRGKLVHLVAPSVWAWKPGRAAKMAALYDHLLCLLPFEPPYFTKHGLNATFIGHPILDYNIPETSETLFRVQNNIAPDTPLLLLLPGSRASEVNRLLPLFIETATRLRAQLPALEIALLAAPHLSAAIRDKTQHVPALRLITDAAQKYPLYRSATAALAASGTVSVELALAGTPHAIAYKISPISYALVRRLITVKYASLVNLLADAPLIPEFIQDDATPEALHAALLPLLRGKKVTPEYAAALDKLQSPDGKSPAQRAAAVLLGLV